MCNFERDPEAYDPDSPFAFADEGGEVDLRSQLNQEQWEAVSTGSGPVLVVAGAGTGKTRVLVHRVAHLVHQGVPPAAILLLTFTRRAADEMLRRASALVQRSFEGVAGGTFHSFSNSLLRRHGATLGLPSNFSILDAADAGDVIGLLRARLELGGRDRPFPRKQTCLAIISAAINRNLELNDAIQERWPHLFAHAADLARLYQSYREYKLELGLVDYDDLLLYARALLEDDDDVRSTISSRFEYVLVDEYQDTNRIQGDIVQLLGRDHENVMVVGDDAQSIYRFRGATVENILAFPDQFPATTCITLEQNYRSTQQILDAANEVLAAARRAYPKHLTATVADGPAPRLIACENENVQSNFVVNRILELREEGLPLSSMAVLFRSSFHSFDLELELNRRHIPYIKYGGFKFMETAHVKDLVAHLKVIDNPRDAPSWSRVLTLLPGIGEATAHRIITALENDDPFNLNRVKVNRRSREHVNRLGSLLRNLVALTGNPSLAVEAALEYYEPLLRERYDDHPKRKTDLEHVTVLAGKHDSIRELLDDFAIEPPSRSLERGELAPAEEEEGSRLVLSTIHSAKGLEWDAVFVLWTLDGRFPSFFALDDPEEIEEERRLMYVAITRARQELSLSYPVGVWDRQGRYLTEPSLFVREIPADILEPWRAHAAGLGLDHRIELQPMRKPLAPPTSLSTEEEWEGSRSTLKRRRGEIDRRILGQLGDEEWTYEVDEDCAD